MVYTDKSAPPPGQQSDFYAGTAAMTIGQLSRVARLKDAKFKWDMAPLPAGPKSQPYVIGQAAIGVFTASKNQQVAKDFVAFMTNKDNVAKLAQFFPPARVSVLEGDALLKANPAVPADRMKQSVVEGIKQGSVMTAHPDFPKIELASQAEFDKLWKPGVDVQAAMTGLCKAIQPLLK
jgi:multiple sugar transport system substrate-binding protein